MSPAIKLPRLLLYITVIWSLQTVSVLADIGIKLPATLTVGYEGIPDEVDYQPRRLEDEQASTTRHRRYSGRFLSATWIAGNRGRLQAVLGSMSLYSKRNVYETKTIALAYQRSFDIHRFQGKSSWSVGIRNNLPDNFKRGTFTQIGDSTLSDTKMESSGDVTAYALLKLSRRFSKKTEYAMQFGGGLTRVSYESLAGNVSSEGCQYAFSVNSNSALLTQQQVCGQIAAYQRSYPTGESIERQFGFSIEKDLEYFAQFWRVSAGVRHQLTRRFGVSLSYIYNHYKRQDIDERITAQGGSPTRSSQTLRASAGYSLTPGLYLISSASYRVAPFLSALPTLYNTFTYEKLDSQALSFSLALRFKLP